MPSGASHLIVVEIAEGLDIYHELGYRIWGSEKCDISADYKP